MISVAATAAPTAMPALAPVDRESEDVVWLDVDGLVVLLIELLLAAAVGAVVAETELVELACATPMVVNMTIGERDVHATPSWPAQLQNVALVQQYSAPLPPHCVSDVPLEHWSNAISNHGVLCSSSWYCESHSLYKIADMSRRSMIYLCTIRGYSASLHLEPAQRRLRWWRRRSLCRSRSLRWHLDGTEYRERRSHRGNSRFLEKLLMPT